jgi:hypothetical protein
LRGLLAPGPSEAHDRLALPSVRPFASPKTSDLPGLAPWPASAPLLRPLLTSRSASRRCPFRRKARSPQVRTTPFPAQSPDLRRFPLVARASRSIARSPWSAAPRIQFLFVDSRFRSPLLSAGSSRFQPCGSLGVPATGFSRRLSPPCCGSCWAHNEDGPDVPDAGAVLSVARSKERVTPPSSFHGDAGSVRAPEPSRPPLADADRASGPAQSGPGPA